MQIKLQEGEQILFEGKPEKRVFAVWFFTKVIPACVAASFVFGYAYFMLWIFTKAIYCGRNVAFPVHIIRIAANLVPVWLAIFYLYYLKLRETFNYCITNQRCVFSGGIMVKRIKNVPFHKITDVEINQNIIEQLLGIYSLKIFTPGTGSVGKSGFEQAEIIFFGLKDAEAPANIVQGMLKKYRATGE